MSTLIILQFYPDQLGVSGDGGNVTALAERARRAGVTVDVVGVRPGDEVPGQADLVLVGSGPLSTLRALQPEFLRSKDRLADWADSGVPVVAVGGGMELLSTGITGDGADLEGLGLFDATAHRGAKRVAGYIQLETAYEGAPLELFGFEDHASRLELGDTASPFAHIVVGGADGAGGTDGVTRGTSFGTQLKGPGLPLNPVLTDRILAAALRRSGDEYAPAASHAKLDEYAQKSRDVIKANIEHRFKSMQ